MKKITKGAEPVSLTAYKRQNPTHRYEDLGEDPHEIRIAIRKACLEEQAYLCCYCCRQIGVSENDCMNEHVLPRQFYPNQTFDFNNILVSCKTKGCCDDSKENQEIQVSPLSEECEISFKFNLNGTVVGLNDKADQTISVLNLGRNLQENKKLIDMRKQAISNFLFINGMSPSDLVEDEELLAIIIDDLKKTTDGKLEPFSPIIINALEAWLNMV